GDHSIFMEVIIVAFFHIIYYWYYFFQLLLVCVIKLYDSVFRPAFVVFSFVEERPVFAKLSPPAVFGAEVKDTFFYHFIARKLLVGAVQDISFAGIKRRAFYFLLLCIVPVDILYVRIDLFWRLFQVIEKIKGNIVAITAPRKSFLGF